MVGATEVLARTLAVELTPIRANVIVAGPVLSDLLEKLAGGKEGLLKVAAGTLTKQVGPPEGIAEAYLFCMRSSLATGQGFIVDNGVSLA
jgi:NAD(P)-dependent dehydrogenase (short-subunit alcohol dehydrogenase family)